MISKQTFQFLKELLKNNDRNWFNANKENYQTAAAEFEDFVNAVITKEMFYTVGRELGYFRLGSNEVKLAIRTSRIFQKIDGHWRQVHHHGSIDDPQLLGRYQTAVLGKRS